MFLLMFKSRAFSWCDPNEIKLYKDAGHESLKWFSCSTELEDKMKRTEQYMSRLVGNQQCGFRPGLTQTELYKYRRWLETGNFGFRK